MLAYKIDDKLLKKIELELNARRSISKDAPKKN